MQSDEYVEEIFYSFDVFRGANVQPDIQYIINPGGYKSARTAGVRNPTERAAVSQFLAQEPGVTDLFGSPLRVSAIGS